MKIKTGLYTLLMCLILAGCSDEKEKEGTGKEGNGSLGKTTEINGTDIETTTTLCGLVSDRDGNGIPGVVVSDGYNCTVTDDNGVYQMVRNKRAVFVFYSTPAEYRIDTDSGNHPAFFEKIDMSEAVYRADFTLDKLAGGSETEFTLFCFADPQVKSTAHVTRYINETMADMKRTVTAYKNPCAMTLGDIIHDTPELLPSIRESMSGQPMVFFQTIGNHDHLASAASDYDAVKNYEDYFGPTCYSFDRGEAHIVSVDNIIYNGNQNYVGGFTDAIYNWLEQDLSYVSDDKLVILCCHIPFRNRGSGTGSNHYYYYHETLELLSRFAEAHIMIGHTHYNENYIHTVNGKTIYEHIHGTTCGAWWNGVICSDGTPNGYGIYTIEGNGIKEWIYKATNYETDHQIRLYDGSQIFGATSKYTYTFGQPTDVIVANVWNADADWRIELFENGVKACDMVSMSSRDWTATYFFLEECSKGVGSDYDKSTKHLYVGTLTTPGADFEVRVTDPYDNVYSENSLFVSPQSYSGY